MERGAYELHQQPLTLLFFFTCRRPEDQTVFFKVCYFLLQFLAGNLWAILWDVVTATGVEDSSVEAASPGCLVDKNAQDPGVWKDPADACNDCAFRGVQVDEKSYNGPPLRRHFSSNCFQHLRRRTC